MTVLYRLLGPLEGPAPLPAGKPSAVLARLLLDAGRVVPAAALVDALWDEPPPSAPKVLQAYVSALRKALGADAIETRAPGYLVPAGLSDLARFEQLAERAHAAGDTATRARLLREALALWRGEPLAEFPREPFAQRAAARLGELRLDALVRRIDADLELGRHEEILVELLELVRAEPLRERLRGQLMTALYRAGRQADALAVYREGRRLMVEELGIEPGRELQALEGAILRQDPALAGPAAAAPHGPVVCVGCAPLDLVGALDRELVLVELVGSGTELATATARLEAARGGDRRVRTACFTSQDPVADAIRLGREQEAELLVVRDAPPALLADAPCSVALLAGAGRFVADGPVLVPFGGDRAEWPALELAAWLARAHGLPLRLLGADAADGRRDASRTLAAASLALQRFADVAAEPAVVAAGPAGILGEAGSLIVASLPAEGPDETRRAIATAARVPVLLVHGGQRPGGLAPDRTLTRFSWSRA